MTVRRTSIFVAVFGLRTIGHARPSGQKVTKGRHAGTRQEREIYSGNRNCQTWKIMGMPERGISRKNEDQGRSWGEEEMRRGSHDSGTGRGYISELKVRLESVMDNLVGGSPLST